MDIIKKLRALGRRRDGAVSILSAFILPALIVTVGMAVEYGNGLLNNIRDQRVADNAAFAAATVYQQNSSASLTSVVDSIAKLDGLSASNISQSIVSSPSGNGNQAVKVTVTTSVPLLLSQALGNSQSLLTASATAYAELGSGNDCILALDPASTGKPAQVTGGTVNVNCGMQVDSSSSGAFTATGGTFSASPINVVGLVSQSGGTVTGTINTGAASLGDPFSGLFSANSVSTLTNQTCPSANKGVHFNGNATITPPTTGMVYCNGLTVSSGTVTFQPGVYIIQGGTLSVSNGLLQGSGVTIILTCGTPPCTSTSNGWAQLSFTGGSTNLSAPTTGAWAGTLLYQDPTDPASGGDTERISGGNNSLEGTLYFPHATTDFTGGATAASCTEIVTYDIDFTGGGTINHNNCASAGIKGFGSGGTVRLVQ